ncbi:tRNA lysidine(34) synthetase TilS [Weissella halotolerans]|uniref:tRNA lysidine(34) synthetase TilS n=1 Tax=Weissella halotolerans TaxID=1615 RepID=UPI0003B36F12|nr:tRNA lysidine(34) synthetase TilS [Weissella halotolerans]
MVKAKVIRANMVRHVRERQLFNANDHVLVAVSGGADSLYLLNWLTNGYLPADIQPTVSAAYINHQLRSDSQAEEEFVRGQFAKISRLETRTIKRLEWEQVPKTAIEEQARDRRYQALEQIANRVGANIMVTAHHQGDQVETILYKLIRGSRLEQLEGMAEKQVRRSGLTLVRPFLCLPKDKLSILSDGSIQQWIEDPTNQDQHYARNRLRHAVLPVLRTINQQADQHILDLSDQIAGQRYLMQAELERQVSRLEAGQLDWQLPKDVLILILQTWLDQQGLVSVKDRQLSQVITLMKNEHVASGQVSLAHGWQLERLGHQLRLRKSTN